MRLLAEIDRPQQILRAEYFRAGRAAGPARAEEDRGTWIDVDRFAVARNGLTDIEGRPCDLSRLVITTDAGVGKTTEMRWLYFVVNRDGDDRVAFFLTFGQLPADPADFFEGTLVPRFQQAEGNQSSRLSVDSAANILRQMRREGRLVLLIDALDQAPPDGRAVATLRSLLEDPDWPRNRFIVSGRPHALQRFWGELFASELGFEWRFLQLDEFDESQQRQFLGEENEGGDRYERIPTDAREILSTPRVLEYLRGLPDTELGNIRTAGDVYWHSLNHLLVEGMKNATEARQLGLDGDQPATSALRVQ